MGRLDSTGWKVLGQKGFSVKSKLFSASDIQSICKKAMVDRLKMTYHTDWFKEDGASFPVRIFLLKDEVTVALDTTGDPLHKRGYRTWTSKAPISRDTGRGSYHADPVAGRPHPGRSFLRQWHFFD